MPAARRQKQDNDEMRPEYDLSDGVRGKYAANFARGTNVVVLAPDVKSGSCDARALSDSLAPRKRGEG
jgi:hypothetical protein